jgi:hypothetical protein
LEISDVLVLPHGYLAANLSAESAQRLRDACPGHVIGVQLVPQSDVIPVIKLVRMHQVQSSFTRSFEILGRLTFPQRAS